MAHHYDHYAAEEWAAHGGDYQSAPAAAAAWAVVVA
jgi:hypothetical protein